MYVFSAAGPVPSLFFTTDAVKLMMLTFVTGVILMEGGAEHDLLSLENPVSDKEEHKEVEEEKVIQKQKDKEETDETAEEQNDERPSPKRGTMLACLRVIQLTIC